MQTRVIDVDEALVYCTREGLTADEARQAGLIWTFDRSTGAEVDHTLGWGPTYGKTGTALVPQERSTETKRRHWDVRTETVGREGESSPDFIADLDDED